MTGMLSVLKWFLPWAALAITIGVLSDLLHGHSSFVRWCLLFLCLQVLQASAEHWLKRVIKEAGCE